jgi:hypothetical protein
MLYGSTEHVEARLAALPGGPAFTALVERFDCEETAAFLAGEAFSHALGMGMPPSVEDYYGRDAFPVSVN